MSFGDDSPFGPWLPTDLSPSKVSTWKQCPWQYAGKYVWRLPRTSGAASMQGSALHKVYLEEFLAGGVEDIDFLVDMVADDLEHRLKTQDPRDYNTKLPLTEAERFDAISDVRIWARGLIAAHMSGEDGYGNKFKLPEIEDTEIEVCKEVVLPKSGRVVRIRGFVDFLFKDGTIGDLKLASDYYKSIWTLGKALTEDQPAMYGKMMGSEGFRYIIVDKRKAKGRATTPSVRSIEFELTLKDFERMIADIEEFVDGSDILNGYENGHFPPRPLYDGNTKKNTGHPEMQFCGKLCDFKEQCWNANFARGDPSAV